MFSISACLIFVANTERSVMTCDATDHVVTASPCILQLIREGLGMRLIRLLMDHSLLIAISALFSLSVRIWQVKMTTTTVGWRCLGFLQPPPRTFLSSSHNMEPFWSTWWVASHLIGPHLHTAWWRNSQLYVTGRNVYIWDQNEPCSQTLPTGNEANQHTV